MWMKSWSNSTRAGHAAIPDSRRPDIRIGRAIRSVRQPGCRGQTPISVLEPAARIDPGKPWQNATNGLFNGKFRDEFLSLQWFRNRMDAKAGIEQWR